MKLAICDDEKQIRDVLADIVREVSESIEIVQYANAQEILSPEFDADILFLDIQMPGTDGMRASKILRSKGKKTIIIFVTALEEQVFNAFDVGAFNYIVKPFSRNRIKDVVKGAIKQAKELEMIEKSLTEKSDELEKYRTITVKSGGANTRVILSEVCYAEVFDRMLVLHMSNGDDIEYYGRMSDLERIAGKDFYRVHRAYLINLGFVKSYDSKAVHMSDGDIPVARGKYPELIKAYMSYHTRREML
ncbi:MAG: response regulator transcription factor [Lachnospiraceae bacterium]|nr:response regulator transcription factor [Lachnospiraceae bacterium]